MHPEGVHVLLKVQKVKKVRNPCVIGVAQCVVVRPQCWPFSIPTKRMPATMCNLYIGDDGTFISETPVGLGVTLSSEWDWQYKTHPDGRYTIRKPNKKGRNGPEDG